MEPSVLRSQACFHPMCCLVDFATAWSRGAMTSTGIGSWGFPMPGIAAGHSVVRKGPITTSEDKFEITVKGRGVHASMPENAVDPKYDLNDEILLSGCRYWAALVEKQLAMKTA